MYRSSLSQLLGDLKMAYKTVEQLKAEAEALLKMAEQQEQAEKSIQKIVADIKKANISKTVLTEILNANGLIEPIIVEKKTEEKQYISSLAIKTKQGRDGTFKLWLKDGKPRKPWLEPATKDNWATVKQHGKDALLASFNDQGKEWLNTDQGKAWLVEMEKAIAPAPTPQQAVNPVATVQQ